MNILFIGGTRFAGLAMAREALRRGHRVDLFHRGGKPFPGLEGARHIHGDRARDLAALAQGQWDATIDTCGYRPGDIHAVADALQGRGGHYCFVSTGSVYAEDIPAGSDETAPLAPTGGLDPATLATVPITGDNYGPLKVLCEQAVRERYADPLVLRPPYIIGPDDYTMRFPEWVKRIAAGGVVEAPGPRGAAIQYVDARDLASFTIAAIERRLAGTFNVSAVQPPFGFGDMLDAILQGVAPAGTQLRWIGVEEARASKTAWPLWHEGMDLGIVAVTSAAARKEGLEGRPLAETARDTLEWLRQKPA
jgi:2'-hydroxyisoflavone reductase